MAGLPPLALIGETKKSLSSLKMLDIRNLTADFNILTCWPSGTWSPPRALNGRG